MRATGILCVAAVVLFVGLEGRAQQRPAAANDPRIGLKPGLRDAGEAARNMERIASMPKPEGFFDPKAPGGTPTPPERDPNLPPLDPDAPPDPRFANMLSFANSDLAFSGNHLFMGSFHGFNTYDIERPGKPKVLASIVCPGGQGDVSVHGNLLFMSVEQTRGRIDCGTQGVSTPVSAERFRGIRIFDITDVSKPKQLAAVQTCRGSHTHTLVPDLHDSANLYIYGSGTGTVRSAEELAGCSGLKPEEDPNTALFSIDVIQVPLAAPQNAKIVNRPRIFADPATGAISGLWQGGTHGEGTQKTSVTNQCHDITVFPEVGLAAGACSGNGILLDIRDPKNPVRLDQVVDKNFAYWHSATINNDGTKVIFTDEWGGGTRPRCRAADPLTWGADAIFDVIETNGSKKLRFGGYFKMPAPQTETENCVAHNGSLIPVPGRDIMVQAWYQGGLSVFDFTDSTTPVEIAFFDRGPIDAKQLITGGYWSTYWYNGAIYGSEIARGIDVFRLKPSEYLSQNEIDAASLVRVEELNTQQQTKITWPASSVVARAYIDQLTRSKSIQPQRARDVKSALDRVDGLRTGQEKGAAATLDQLDALAAQLEKDAAAASGRDADRLKALAATIKGRAVKLRS
ncbi:MAG: hypothetical protein AUH43_15785 [Acidobacteria bacterium 13_1_40CM_65_14]|nr:MAG: hypothetical protein AUH43_15785 [Acidobacteria bacterium 13_1_40CM_65_14]OLE83312.1 MAG: hypothetical protein AUF76_06790 [Acidobacteria bacterium 13_1_20CM_2_65_9]